MTRSLDRIRARRGRIGKPGWRRERNGDPATVLMPEAGSAHVTVMAYTGSVANADFIVAAPRDIDHLLAIIDAVRAEVDFAVWNAVRWEDKLPVPEWVEIIQHALDTATTRDRVHVWRNDPAQQASFEARRPK